MDRSVRIEYVLITLFISLLVFPVFYVLRFLDDNVLVSWNWVFDAAGLPKIYLVIFCVVIVSLLLSRVPVPRKLYRPLLLSFPFFIVLPLWGVPEAILDSSRYFVQAKYLAINGISYFLREWGNDIPAWTDLPLVSFLYGLIFKFLGEYRVVIQIFNTTIFSLSALVTYLLGKELWDDEVGFYAGLFLEGIPYLLIQVPLMMVDISAMFLVTLSVLMFIRTIRYGGYKNIILSAVVTVSAMLTKYSLWVMLLVLPITLFVFIQDTGKKAIKRSLWAAGVTSVLLLIMIVMKYDLFIEQIVLLRTYQWPALSKWREGFISTFFFQSHPFLVALAIFGAYRALKERDGRFIIPGWFAVFILVLRVERIRYIVPLFPFFTLMASYGLMKIRLEDVRRIVLYCVIGLSLVVVYTGYAPFLKRTSMANLQSAGKYLDELETPAAVVYTLPQKVSSGNTNIVVPILDLFTSKEIVFRQEAGLTSDMADHGVSPLRFTWEFVMPGFYYNDTADIENVPVVVISSDKDDMFIPAVRSSIYFSDFESMKSFDISSGVFRFKSFVSIYGRLPLSVSGH